MAGETDYGANPARIGNPLLYPRRIFMILLNSFFAQEQYVDFPGAPENRYKVVCLPDGTIDKTASTLVISDSYDTEVASSRPQIVISRGQMSWSDESIGDRSSVQGFDSFRDRVIIPIIFSVYSANDIEAESLAWAISFFIKFTERTVRSATLFEKIDSTYIGPVVPSKVDSKIDLFQIDLQTNIEMSVNWINKSTLSLADIKAGFCKLSGDKLPMFLADLCVTASTPTT